MIMQFHSVKKVLPVSSFPQTTAALPQCLNEDSPKLLLSQHVRLSPPKCLPTFKLK